MTVEQAGVEYDVQAQNVWKSFKDQVVLQDLSFKVQRGEIFGLIGPSGSGKTTTIRLVTGVYRATKGKLMVLGRNPSRFDRQSREQMGYLPQQFVLYPNLSVMENMRFVASLYGIAPWKRGDRIRHTLEFVEMWDARDRLATEISGGMQRRLELAAALLHTPHLIVADEPTAGVDPVLRARFWEEFKSLREEGRTLFVTTQYVTEAEYCDHVALVAGGRMVANDTPDNLRRLAVGGEALDVSAGGLTETDLAALRELDGVLDVSTTEPNRYRFLLRNAGSMVTQILNAVQERGGTVHSAEEWRPNFDEVFVMLLERSGGRADGSSAELPPSG